MQMAGEVGKLAASGLLFAQAAGWLQANPDTVQALLTEQVLCYSFRLQVLLALTGSIQKSDLVCQNGVQQSLGARVAKSGPDPRAWPWESPYAPQAEDGIWPRR